jgi:hypothetical protein
MIRGGWFFSAAVLALLWALSCGGFRSGSACAQSEKPRASPSSSSASIPDISGVWTPGPGSGNGGNIFRRDEEPPMTPWGQARFNEHKPSFGPRAVAQSNNPTFDCYPPGVPQVYFYPLLVELVQLPNKVIQIFEYDHTIRYIYTDGRPHPPAEEWTPTYMGHSIGHYEGDTLVVDTVGFNDKTWLDRVGHAHSDQMHLIERFRRVDHDTLQISMTIEDPKTYTRVGAGQFVYKFQPKWDVGEYVCQDNADFVHKFYEKSISPVQPAQPAK